MGRHGHHRDWPGEPKFSHDPGIDIAEAGHSRTIGLIVPDITNPFFTDVACGVEYVTSAAGALVMVCNSDDDPDKEGRYLTMPAEQPVQGALIVPVRGSQAGGSVLRARGVPVVLLDSTDTSFTMCSVAVNDVPGGRIATAHLLAAGHRRVGFVGSGHEAHQVVDRAAGAALAMVDAGHSTGALIDLPANPPNVTGGARAAQQWLALPVRRRPTAVFCANDLLALGLLHELLRAGVRIPDDLAIVGYDDITVVGYDDITFAEAAAAPLTSVRQPRQELGERAAELLLAESGTDSHVHVSVIFEPELVVRESSLGARRRRARGAAAGEPRPPS